MSDEWDLGEVLSERNQPRDTVNVFLNEAASYAKAQLVKAHAKAPKDKVEEIEAELKKVDEMLENSRYVIHITALPSRMREDIHSKALAKFPMKPDPLWGRDDAENTRQRNIYENNLLWHAHITDVVNPLGKSKSTWTVEEIERFSQSLPSAVQIGIDTAIRELNKQAEEYTLVAKSIDF